MVVCHELDAQWHVRLIAFANGGSQCRVAEQIPSLKLPTIIWNAMISPSHRSDWWTRMAPCCGRAPAFGSLAVEGLRFCPTIWTLPGGISPIWRNHFQLDLLKVDSDTYKGEFFLILCCREGLDQVEFQTEESCVGHTIVDVPESGDHIAQVLQSDCRLYDFA